MARIVLSDMMRVEVAVDDRVVVIVQSQVPMLRCGRHRGQLPGQEHDCHERTDQGRSHGAIMCAP